MAGPDRQRESSAKADPDVGIERRHPAPLPTPTGPGAAHHWGTRRVDGRKSVAALAASGGQPAVPKGTVAPWPAPTSAHMSALERVLISGRYHRVNHPIVSELEAAARDWTGGLRVRAVSSGSAAIHVAVDYFKERGRYVIASALNWPSAVAPVRFAGLEPRFVDVSLGDACLHEDAASAALGPDTAIVLVTHLFGNAAALPSLRRGARSIGPVAIIDDCAQGVLVARQRHEDPSIDSDAFALSGNGAKHLGAGELGLLCSREGRVLDHVDLVSLSSSARDGSRVFSPMTYGYNYRPNVFSCAIASHRFSELDGQISARRSNARLVSSRLSGTPGLWPLFDAEQEMNSFCSLALRLDPLALGFSQGAALRDSVVELLKAEGVPAGVWLTKPAWEYLPFWQSGWSKTDFPNTATLVDTMFYIPEIAPPNDEVCMTSYVNAFEKIWAALPYLHNAIDGGKSRRPKS